MDDLLFVLKQRKKTVQDNTQAVYEFMVKEELQKKLEEAGKNCFKRQGTGACQRVRTSVSDYDRSV